MNDRDAGTVHETYTGTFSETCKPQKHGQRHETTGHNLHEAVVRECMRKQMFSVNGHASQIIMFEVAVGIKVKADKNCDDFGIRHYALSSTFWSYTFGWKGIFAISTSNSL